MNFKPILFVAAVICLQSQSIKAEELKPFTIQLKRVNSTDFCSVTCANGKPTNGFSKKFTSNEYYKFNDNCKLNSKGACIFNLEDKSLRSDIEDCEAKAADYCSDVDLKSTNNHLSENNQSALIESTLPKSSSGDKYVEGATYIPHQNRQTNQNTSLNQLSEFKITNNFNENETFEAGSLVNCKIKERDLETGKLVEFPLNGKISKDSNSQLILIIPTEGGYNPEYREKMTPQEFKSKCKLKK